MKKIIFLIFIYLVSTSVSAGSIACSGKIDMLFAKRDGKIELYSEELYGSSQGRTLCDMTAEWKGVDTNTCKTWYSNLLAQSSQNKPAVVYYLDTEVNNCTSISTFNNAASPFGIADNVK